MSTERRPSLTPVLWARILARYGELGRPLTDAELRAIVAKADTTAADFSVTREFAGGTLVIDAGRPLRPGITHRDALALVAEECNSFDGLTLNDAGKGQAQESNTMDDKNLPQAVEPAKGVITGGSYTVWGLDPDSDRCMIWEGALALVKAGVVGDLSEAVEQATAAHKLLPPRGVGSVPSC